MVEKAVQQGCLGVVSTLNEPAANYYLFRDLAVQAKEKGLLAGCSTNCYFTGETLEELGKLVDFMLIFTIPISRIIYLTENAEELS